MCGREEGAGDEDGAAFVFWSGVWSSEVKQASGQLTVSRAKKGQTSTRRLYHESYQLRGGLRTHHTHHII